MQKSYNLWKFLFDLFMILITGGLWMIWIMFKFFKDNAQ